MLRRVFRGASQNPLCFHQLRRNRAGQLEHSFIAGWRMFLRQESDRRRFLERNFSFIRRGFAQDQGEERRFSGAIRPDQSNPIATIYLERRIFKEDASGEGFRDLGNREHASGGESRESLRRRNQSSGLLISQRDIGSPRIA